MAAQWACNAAQWLRTALTDVYHAMGQAEVGSNAELARKYKAIASALEKQEKALQLKYGVPPATGVGKRMRREKKQK
jgi:hypothetical protein